MVTRARRPSNSRGPIKLTTWLVRSRPHNSSGERLLRPSTSTSCILAHQAGMGLQGEFILQGLQANQALGLDVFRHLIGKSRGPGLGAGGILKGKGLVEPGLPHQVKGLDESQPRSPRESPRSDRWTGRCRGRHCRSARDLFQVVLPGCNPGSSALRIRLAPDCTGRWRCSHRAGNSPKALISSGDRSRG